MTQYDHRAVKVKCFVTVCLTLRKMLGYQIPVSCNESNQRRCYYQKGLLVIQNIDHHWLTKKK